MTNKSERIRFTFRIPDELLSLLKKEADKTGVSVNAQILHIIKLHFDEKQIQN